MGNPLRKYFSIGGNDFGSGLCSGRVGTWLARAFGKAGPRFLKGIFGCRSFRVGGLGGGAAGWTLGLGFREMICSSGRIFRESVSRFLRNGAVGRFLKRLGGFLKRIFASCGQTGLNFWNLSAIGTLEGSRGKFPLNPRRRVLI
jgi:hypothetical protein